MTKKVIKFAIPASVVLTVLTVLVLLLVGIITLPTFAQVVEPAVAADTTEVNNEQTTDEPTEELTNDPQTSYNPNMDVWELILINADYKVPLEFRVTLQKVTGGYLVDKRIVDPLTDMISAAASDGINLSLCSAFRTVKMQQGLLDSKVSQYRRSGKSEDEAYRLARYYLAYPGFSEHHTGLAVDFISDGFTTLNENFANSDAYSWLLENAHLYGFILRYPENKEELTGFKFEPWHYRYVGVEHATAIKEKALCLEEYLGAS